MELNGERLPIKTFKDYCNLYITASRNDELDENNKNIALVHEKVNQRWEVRGSNFQYDHTGIVNYSRVGLG